jgi:O-antigen ligase
MFASSSADFPAQSKMNLIKTHILGVCLFLFCALPLIVDRGASIGWAPLLLVSIFFSFSSSLKGRLKKRDWVFIVCLCSFFLLASVNSLVHGFSDLDGLDNYARFLLVIPIFLALRLYAPPRIYIISGLIISGVGALLIATKQVYINGEPFAYGYLHKIHFGGFSILISFLCFLFFIERPLDNQKIPAFLNLLIIAAAVSAFLASIFSFSRGAWMAAPVFLVILMFSLYRKKKGEKKRLSWVIFLIPLLFLVSFQFEGKIKKIATRAATDSVAYFSNNQIKGSAGPRLEMWRAAVLITGENPVFGVGIDRFRERKDEMVVNGDVSRKIEQYYHPHSEYFKIMSEQGFVGLLGHLALLVFIFRYFLQGLSLDRLSGLGGLTVLSSFSVFGLTEPYFRYQSGVLMFAVFLCIFAAYSFPRNQKGNPGDKEASL